MMRSQAEKGSTQGCRSQHLRMGYGGQATSCEAGPDSVLELLPLSGPLCRETPLGGWGLHSGPISGRALGVTGQADSASRLHNEGCLKDWGVLLLLGEHLQTLGYPSPEGRV